MSMEMQENDIDVQFSPKRQKLSTNNLLTFESSIRHPDVFLSRELMVLHTDPSRTEASGPQFCKMSQKIGGLEKEFCSGSNMSEIQSSTEAKMTNLLIKDVSIMPSTFEDIPTSTKVQENETKVQSEEEAASEEINLRYIELAADEVKLIHLNSERAQWEDDQALLPEVECASDLEEGFQSTKDITSTLSRTVKVELRPKEQIISVQRKLETNEDEIEQLMKVWQGQCEEMSPEDHDFASRETGALSSFLGNELSCVQWELRTSRCLQEDILENQLIVDKQSVNELDSSLDAIRNSSHKLHGAEDEISNENIDIRRRNIELLNENSRLMECMMQQAAKDQSKLDSAERKIIELQDKLESMSALQKDMGLQTFELIEGNIRIEELTSQETERLDKLEEDLKARKVADPNQKRAATQKQLYEYLGSLKQRVTLLERKCKDLTLKVQEYESIKGRVEENVTVEAQVKVSRREIGKLKQIYGEKRAKNVSRVAEKFSDQHHLSSDPNDDIEFSSDLNVDGNDDDPDDEVGSLACIEQGERNLRIKCGKFYVLVSDAKYFDIDWKEHWGPVKAVRYSCRDCLKKFNNLPDMKDHIWTQHYGGGFKCPYCEESAYKIKWRKNFGDHMKNKHGNECKK